MQSGEIGGPDDPLALAATKIPCDHWANGEAAAGAATSGTAPMGPRGDGKEARAGLPR